MELLDKLSQVDVSLYLFQLAETNERNNKQKQRRPTNWIIITFADRLSEIWIISLLYYLAYFYVMTRAEQLGLATPENYNYLSQSGTYTVDGTNDVQEFAETIKG